MAIVITSQGKPRKSKEQPKIQLKHYGEMKFLSEHHGRGKLMRQSPVSL